MNIALNLLPTQSKTAQATASKSSSSSTKSQSKTSFSDTLNKAVSQSNEATVNEQEQISAGDSKDSTLTNNVDKKTNATTNQEPTATDTAESVEGDNTSHDESNLLTQDVLTNLANAALAAQIPLAIPVASTANTANAVNTVNATAPPVVPVQQPTVAISTAETISKFVQAETAAASVSDSGSNNQSNQKQNAVTNLVQAGQAAPEMLNKLAGSVTDVVSSNTSEQVNSTQPSVDTVNIQNQAVKVEGDQNPNATLLSQVTVSRQEQPTAKVGTVQNPSGAALAQQAVATQSQTVKAEAITTANSMTTAQELQPSEQEQAPIAAIEANQQQSSLRSNLSGEQQGEGLTDTGTLKVAQDIPNKGVEVTNSTTFAQNLEATLVSSGGATLSAKPTEIQAQATPDVYQVVDQIVEQAKIITKQQNTEMIMQLKPEHLGELTLKVAVENGVVNASFHSNNPEVRSLIEASLPQLKQELANTGLKVDNVSVYAGLSQFQPNHGQDKNQQQQLMKFTNKKSADDFVEAVEGELAGGSLPGVGSQSGVDYRI